MLRRKTMKDRKTHPYVVFQIDRGLKARLERKVDKLKEQGKPNASMSAFVENLIRKAV